MIFRGITVAQINRVFGGHSQHQCAGFLGYNFSRKCLEIRFINCDDGRVVIFSAENFENCPFFLDKYIRAEKRAW